ncbi:hypothetical protein OB03_07355 [Brevundimonas sp. GN22]
MLSSLTGEAGSIFYTGAHLYLDLAGANTFAGTLSGGELIKRGAGTLSLTGGGSQLTNIDVERGALTVGAGASVAGNFYVHDGARLGGSGIIGDGTGSVVVFDGATLTPGNSVGTLTVNGDLYLEPGSRTVFELGAPSSIQGGTSINDQLIVTRDLYLGGTLVVQKSADANDGLFGSGYFRLIRFGGNLTEMGRSLEDRTGVSDPNATSRILTNSDGAIDFYTYSPGDVGLQLWRGGNGVWTASSQFWVGDGGDAFSTWGSGVAVFRMRRA